MPGSRLSLIATPTVFLGPFIPAPPPPPPPPTAVHIRSRLSLMATPTERLGSFTPAPPGPPVPTAIVTGTTVGQLLSQLATMVQEDGSTYGGTDWSSGLWTVDEIIYYINTVCRDFILQTQIIKLIAAVGSVTGQRVYEDPEYTMQIDRIAFNNKPIYRTNRYMLDRQNVNWPTLAGLPKQYHQDQLPTKTFEADRAPTSAMTGTGYTAVGKFGTLRYMMHGGTSVTDASTTGGSNVVNSPSASFSNADVGKTIAIAGAGANGGPFIDVIQSIGSSTQAHTTNITPTTTSNTTAAWASPSTFYTATLPASGGGVLRWWVGTPAINGILPHDRPYAGTLRQMFTGVTNFEVLATRLMDVVEKTTDLLRVPDYTVMYIKYGVLKKMLMKEGEGQDIPRAKYAETRYNFGVQLFRRLMSAGHDQVSPQVGSVKA